MKVLRVLIKEEMQQSQSYSGGPIQRRGIESDEIMEEQGWLARLVHLVQNKNDEIHLQVGVRPQIFDNTYHFIVITDTAKSLCGR